MSCTITRRIGGASFEEVEARTREALSAKGFGILTEIDVKETMEKIAREIAACVILGACNPKMA